MEQRGVLRHHTDLGTQAVLRHFSDILAVDQNAPTVEIIEAQQQAHERRLAGT